jgi:hypothetical protein
VATLTVIWWRDIPAQVVAREGRQTHKLVLDGRFQDAIDRAAGKAGLQDFEDYLAEWRKLERDCGDDLEAEATAEVERLESAYDKQALKRLVASGGVDQE